MRLHIRHISLVLGILLTTFSFLFFGREQRIYTTILLVGLFLSVVSFVWILFKDSKQEKWLWFVVLVTAILIQQFSEPFLINYSYNTFVDRNAKLLSDVNQIIQSKEGDIFYLRSSQQDSSKFNSEENAKIRKLFTETSIYLISKDSSKVYYGTYGMLDVRLGIFYFYTLKVPDERFKRIRDKWYY
jgi:hypothetical protein